MTAPQQQKGSSVQQQGQPLAATDTTRCCAAQTQAAPEPASPAPAAAGTQPAAAAAAACSGVPGSWRRPYSPGPLSPFEFEQYWEQGFVIKRGLLTQRDLQPCLRAIERRVDEVVTKLLSAGLISDPVAHADVFTRLALIEQQFGEASVLVHKDGRLPPEFAVLWSHPLLLDINRQLLGPDIGGHPSWNLRAKTPRQEAGNVPWHQDSAYCHPDSWSTLQVTAWIPLLDVDVSKGCMQLLAGGHRSGRTTAHTCAVGDTWYLRMDEASAVADLGVDFSRDLVTAEMRAGDVLLFNNLIPHRSLDNTSSVVRWSLDLRWQHPDLPDGAFGLKRPIVMARAGGQQQQQQQQQVQVQQEQEAQGAYNMTQQQKVQQQQQVQQQGGGAAVDDCDTVGWPPGIDWASWAAVDKKSGSTAGLADVDTLAGVDPALSTILVGPWLDLWPTTHTNKHTHAWQAFKHAMQQQEQQQQ